MMSRLALKKSESLSIIDKKRVSWILKYKSQYYNNKKHRRRELYSTDQDEDENDDELHNY